MWGGYVVEMEPAGKNRGDHLAVHRYCLRSMEDLLVPRKNVLRRPCRINAWSASLGCYLSHLRRMMMTAEACSGEADERAESHDYHAGRREAQRILAPHGFHCPQQRPSDSLPHPTHKKTQCGHRQK